MNDSPDDYDDYQPPARYKDPRDRRERRNGISYWRFSGYTQKDGDSQERQDRDFRCFCDRFNLAPLSRKWGDKARSGWTGANRTKGELGKLIAAAQKKVFSKGDVVVIEAWDRFGRRRADLAIKDIAELLETGVDIGIVRLGDIFTLSDFGTPKWNTLAIFVGLAHEESKQKSERLKSAWAARRKKARKGERLLTPILPFWCDLVDGVAVKNDDKALALERVFELAALDYGYTRLIRQLVKEGVPAFGRSGRWTRAYLENILSDRRVLGELQPKRDDGGPCGPPIAKALPRVISDDAFALAAAARAARTEETPGKNGPRVRRDAKHINIFAGLLRDAIDGGGFIAVPRWKAGRATMGGLVLRNLLGKEGHGDTRTIPYEVFEAAVLLRLKELRPKDVLRTTEAPSKIDVLEERLRVLRKAIDGHLANIRAENDRPEPSDALLRRYDELLRDVISREEVVNKELFEEKARSVRPVESALLELPTLVDLVREKGDEGRLAIRPVLRSIVDDARLLLVRRGSIMLALVQFFFTDGGDRRTYLVVYRSAGNGRPRGAWVVSVAKSDRTAADLKDPAVVLAARARLLALDLAEIMREDNRAPLD